MKWNGIAGSWRTLDQEVISDVERVVTEILERDEGIVVGGALGVDYVATKTVLEKGNPRRHLKVFLPTSFIDYLAHYNRMQVQGTINAEQEYALTHQLMNIKAEYHACIFDDGRFANPSETAYYARIDRQVETSDSWEAFRVNESKGVGYGIEKARAKGIPVHVREYTIKKK